MNGLPDNGYPPGDLRSIVFHWTAGDYHTAFASYHVCVGTIGSDRAAAVVTSDFRANMRDVRDAGGTYAAHTSGRNSRALGLAICAMEGATPSDFGRYPLRDEFVAIACRAAAGLCATYGIPVDAEHVYTHAEAALEDGYFGCGDDERWDIARLTPSREPLRPREARDVGDELRRRVLAAAGDILIAR